MTKVLKYYAKGKQENMLKTMLIAVSEKNTTKFDDC